MHHQGSPANTSHRQRNAALGLVLAFAVSVTDLTDFVSLEEKDLAQSLVGVYFRWQRRGVKLF